MTDVSHGEWFIPNGKKFSGQLINDYTNGIIILELYGQEYIEGSKIDFPTSRPKFDHMIILGDCRNFHLTLYNVSYKTCAKIGKDFYRIEYLVEFVINGTHFTDLENILVHGATFIFPNLSSWYDGSYYSSKLEGQKGVYIGNEHAPQNTLTSEQLTVNEDLELFFWDDVQKSILEFSVSYKVQYTKFLTFKYKNEVHLVRLLNDSITFRKLLELSFGMPLTHKLLSLGVDCTHFTGDNYSNEKILNISVINYSLDENKPIEGNSLLNHGMLFSRWNLTRIELNDIIKRWFAGSRFSNIYEYYLESNYWFDDPKALLTNIMFNNRFLNLIQGLEDYYRELFETEKTVRERKEFDDKKGEVLSFIDDKDLKKWLNDNFNFTPHYNLREKLAAVIQNTYPYLKGKISDQLLQKFPQSAKNYRNSLSHGMTKEINQGQEFKMNYLIAQISLAICIMSSLNVGDIEKKIAHYAKFNRTFAEINFLKQELNL